jgi:hypothetical protein
LEFTDKQGRPRTVAVIFDKQLGVNVHPFTREPITSNDQLENLPSRGYAQSTKGAGYNELGQEISRDERTGAKFIVEVDENGEKKYTPYNGIVYPKRENPPATFTMAVAELGNAGELLKTITTSFDEKFVGPVAARAGKLTKFVDALTDEQRVAFYGNVAEYKNSIIKAITGAQMSEQEATRIIQQIPDENASPRAFLAGVKRAHDMTRRRMGQMEKAIARSGGIVRGEDEQAIGEDELTALVEAKLGKLRGDNSPSGKADPAMDALAKTLGLPKKKGN